MQYNYDDYDEGAEGTIDKAQQDKDTKELALKKVVEISRKEKELKREKLSYLCALSNPEDKEKTLSLTTKAVKTIMTSEITIENRSEEPFKDFTEEDKEFFDKKKYSTVYGLHNSIVSDVEVSESIDTLKDEGMKYDGRKQRHKKKPGEYVENMASFKVLFDVVKKQKEQALQIAHLELMVQNNMAKTEGRLDMIEEELILQRKINALLTLGIEPKKVEAYRLSLERPELTRQALAEELGKSKPTVIKWLQEVKAEVDKSASLQVMR